MKPQKYLEIAKVYADSFQDFRKESTDVTNLIDGKKNFELRIAFSQEKYLEIESELRKFLLEKTLGDILKQEIPKKIDNDSSIHPKDRLWFTEVCKKISEAETPVLDEYVSELFSVMSKFTSLYDQILKISDNYYGPLSLIEPDAVAEKLCESSDFLEILDDSWKHYLFLNDSLRITAESTESLSPDKSMYYIVPLEGRTTDIVAVKLSSSSGDGSRRKYFFDVIVDRDVFDFQDIEGIVYAPNGSSEIISPIQELFRFNVFAKPRIIKEVVTEYGYGLIEEYAGS
ncbi:MAG: hypothetical protein GOU99_02735 [Candidatus Altiarchaeota archaeon]|nr:hypothetical protein [Candidatus Altiarchaeota archaeon]